MIGFICAIEHEPDNQEFMIWLYHEFKELMYATVLKYTLNPDAADDVVQDSIVRLLKKMDVIRPMKKNILASYIVSTVKNTAISTMRKQTYYDAHTADYGEEFSSESLPLDKLVILAEQNAQLASIWPHLSEVEQLLLEGKYILGFSNQELAEQLECQPNSVRMKLTRARRHALSLLIAKGVEYCDEA